MYERAGMGQSTLGTEWVDVGEGWIGRRAQATGLPWMRTSVRIPKGVHPRLPEGMSCHCYEKMAREMIAPVAHPYSLEVNTLGRDFKCTCNPTMVCPESVHRGVSTRDPWRAHVCKQWIDQTKETASRVIASEEFRSQMARAVAKAGEIPGWQQLFMQPAEFTEVLEEREARERPIIIVGVLAIAAGGGFLLWKFLRGKR